MATKTTYDPKYFAFEIVHPNAVADTLNKKYLSGWRVVHMVPHPDGRVMLLLQNSGHAQNN
jgi:hypothetical protein